MFYKQLRSWSRALWRWIAEGRVVWMFFLVLAAALLFCFFTSRNEFSIRFSGYILQMLGIFFTLHGLLRIRSHFRQAPLRKVLIGYFKRFPKWRSRFVLKIESGHITFAGQKPRITVWAADNATESAEKRIEAIVANMRRLRKNQLRIDQSVDVISESLELRRKAEAEAREKLERALRAHLESLHTSGIMTSLCGLVWVAVGLSMSSFSVELSKWLS